MISNKWSIQFTFYASFSWSFIMTICNINTYILISRCFHSRSISSTYSRRSCTSMELYFICYWTPCSYTIKVIIINIHQNIFSITFDSGSFIKFGITSTSCIININSCSITISYSISTTSIYCSIRYI